MVLIAVVQAVGIPITELVTTQALLLSPVSLSGRAGESGEARVAVYLITPVLAVLDSVTALECANDFALEA
jgi:hypothetical protein